MCFYYTLDRGVYEIAHGRYVEMDGQARLVGEFYQFVVYAWQATPCRVHTYTYSASSRSTSLMTWPRPANTSNKHAPTRPSILTASPLLHPKMPRLDADSSQQLRALEQGARTHTMNALDSFSNFALRDNVLEVAVGLM
jgi:hypothetical protein